MTYVLSPVAVALLAAVPQSSLAAQSASRSVQKQCTLVVDGKRLVSGRCSVFSLDRGGYTLNTWYNGTPRQPHFAQVNTDAPGNGEAFWNKDPSDDHAQDALGRMRLIDGCWMFARVRMCVR